MPSVPPVPAPRPAPGLLFFAIILLLLIARVGFGATRIIDRMDVEIGSENNNIHLHFNIPIRVISHLSSSTRRELNIQVQATPTPGSAQDFVGRDEVLSWRPSAEMPLDRIRLRPQGVGTSVIEMSFVTPVQAYVVQKQRNFFSLTITLKNEKPVEQTVLPESFVPGHGISDERVD